jgi:hypothetical protein
VTDPVPIPARFYSCVAPDSGDCSASYFEETLVLVEYAELLIRKCHELDRLIEQSTAYHREATQFFLKARALYEVTRLLENEAPAATRDRFEELRAKAERFYFAALEEGRVTSALEKTHPTHYRRLQRNASEALNLLTRNRTMSGGRTLTGTLDALLTSSPESTYVHDLIEGYVLPNWAALAERVGKTQVCPELAAAVADGFERVTAGASPAPQHLPDWLLWFGEHSAAAISNGLSSGPIGNSAVAYLLESVLPLVRLDRDARVLGSLRGWLSYAMPALERARMRALLDDGQYDEAKALFREHHFSGTAATLLFVVVDWVNVFTQVQAMIADERQRTVRNGFALAIDSTTAVVDTVVFVGRARVSVRQLANRMLAAEELEAAAVARTSGRVFQLEAFLGREIATVGGRALTIGASVNVVFSAVMCVVELGDGITDLMDGDTTGATFAGIRFVGSALIGASVFCPGPWSVVTAGFGIALVIIGSFEPGPDEPPPRPPAKALILDLIASLRRRCPAGSEVNRMETPRPRPSMEGVDRRYRAMDAGVAPPPIVVETTRQIIEVVGGLSGPLSELEAALPASDEHYHQIVVADDAAAVRLRRRLRALGLASDYGLVRSRRSPADRTRMRALE